MIMVMKPTHAQILKVKDTNVFQQMTVRTFYPFGQKELTTIMIMKILVQPAVIHLKLVVIKKE